MRSRFFQMNPSKKKEMVQSHNNINKNVEDSDEEECQDAGYNSHQMNTQKCRFSAESKSPDPLHPKCHGRRLG